jgi:hypothetical protein
MTFAVFLPTIQAGVEFLSRGLKKDERIWNLACTFAFLGCLLKWRKERQLTSDFLTRGLRISARLMSSDCVKKP